MDKPKYCPDHPNAYIKHVCDKSHYILNGYCPGAGILSNHKYYCNDCGLELEPDCAKLEKVN